jgi:hypothetical protein
MPRRIAHGCRPRVPGLPSFLSVYKPVIGLSCARNTSRKPARGSVCRVPRRRQLRRRFGRVNSVCFHRDNACGRHRWLGRADFGSRDPNAVRPPRASTRHRERARCPACCTTSGSNGSSERTAQSPPRSIEHPGGFDTSLVRSGFCLLSGEEVALQRRALDRAYPCCIILLCTLAMWWPATWELTRPLCGSFVNCCRRAARLRCLRSTISMGHSARLGRIRRVTLQEELKSSSFDTEYSA